MTRDINADLEKLANAFFTSLQMDKSCGYGSIGQSSKRPFGNSDAPEHILEIIGAECEGDDGDEPCYSSKQRAYAQSLFDNLIPYLQRRNQNYLRLVKLAERQQPGTPESCSE